MLDVNPNADISPDTSLALAAEVAGLSYGKLGSLLVKLASRRHPVFGQHYRIFREHIGELSDMLWMGRTKDAPLNENLLDQRLSNPTNAEALE